MNWAERDTALAVRGVSSDQSISLSTEDMQVREVVSLQTPNSCQAEH